MNITPRQITLGILGMLITATLAIIFIDLRSGVFNTLTLADTVAAFLFGALFWTAYRGWRYTNYVVVILVALLVGVVLTEPYLSQQYSGVLLIPAIVALALTNSRWIIGSAAVTLLLVLARAGWQGIYTDPFTLVVIGVNVSGLVLGRLVTTSAIHAAQRAQATAEQVTTALQTSNANLELRVTDRTAALQTALAQVTEREANQRELLMELAQQREAIRELSVPILPVSRTTLVMPLIGALDAARLQQMRERALAAVERHKARYLFIDLTGVPVVDTEVSRSLLDAAQAVRLLGAQAVLIGIRPEVAQTLVSLGIDLRTVQTQQDLQTALARFANQ